jgi:hypothetical protein
MMRHYLDNLWRWGARLPETNVPLPISIPSLEELKDTEWSPEFEQLMRNRLIMGAIRYGRISAPGKPQLDRVNSMFKRLAKYTETGNTEFLVDVANICLLEFVEGNHPKKHFHSIDEQEHIAVIPK